MAGIPLLMAQSIAAERGICNLSGQWQALLRGPERCDRGLRFCGVTGCNFVLTHGISYYDYYRPGLLIGAEL